MGPPLIVADTNLIAYLLIDGDRTAEAEAVFTRDPIWASPLLWRSELRNVLSYHVHRRLFPLEHALALAEQAEEVIEGRDFAVATADVLELAASSGCSSYDCEFVVLARELDLPLVTADRTVLRSFPERAISLTRFAAQPRN